MRTPVLRAAIAALGAVALAQQAPAQTVEYYSTDVVGNVRLVTSQAGAVLERHDYLPFGEECVAGPCTSNEGRGNAQPLRLTGRERDSETGLDYFGARHYRAETGRFTSVDPVYNWKNNVTDPQRWHRHAYARNNPLRFVDPDGRDAIPVAFPEYQIGTPVGRIPNLGHAGIILIDSRTGATRYYEYGRYDSKGLGRVRRGKDVPRVQMGKDGKPTQASMNRLLAHVSRQSGQGGPVEGAYIKNDNYGEMVRYAEGRLKQNEDPNREPYSLTGNNCATFMQDTLEAGDVDTPWMLDPRPNSYIGELQDSSDSSIRYDPPKKKN